MGRWAEEEGVSGPDGSEEGRWREVVRTQEMRNQGRPEKGQKAENAEKMEQHKKEAKQNYGQPHETEGRQRRRREGNRKEQDEWERM